MVVMKMKNINVEPTLHFDGLSEEKMAPGSVLDGPAGGRPVYQCPPLPPRMRHRPAPDTALSAPDTSGHGAECEPGVYKSVPPPRLLGESALNGGGGGGGRLSGSDPMLANQEIQLHSSKFPVERELSLVDKTVEKTSFQQYSRSLGRDGRLVEPAVERYSGPPPPGPGHTTLSLTRAGRLPSAVERQSSGSRDQLLQLAASVGDGIDNPAMEDPYGVYRGPGRASGRGQQEYGPGQPAVGGVSGSDNLRDACTRMFQRDGWGRGSQTVRVPHTAAGMPAQGPRLGLDGPATSVGPDPAEGEQDRSKNGTLTKKYYHIKDMISNRLGKLGTEPAGRVAASSAAAAPAAAQNNVVNGRASNINSSFRKAMQRSTQKSNLTDESGVMYSMSNLSLEAGSQQGYTPASAGPTGTQYGYTGGYGAAQGRLSQAPQPPPASHAQYGTTPGYGTAAAEHAAGPGTPHYGPGTAAPIYGTAAQPGGGAPWQQQRPLPPQPYPAPPPPRPAGYGVCQPRPGPGPGPHQTRPAAPPAYGTHQPNGAHFNGQPLMGQQLYGQHPAASHFAGQHPPGAAFSSPQTTVPAFNGTQMSTPSFSGPQTSGPPFSSPQTSMTHFNGPQSSGAPFSSQQTTAPSVASPQQMAAVYGGRQDGPARPGVESAYGQTAPPPSQRPPPPPASPPPTEDPQPAPGTAAVAGAAAAAAAAADPPYASRQELQKDGAFGHSSDSGNGSSQSAAGAELQKVASPAPLDSSLDSDAQSGRQKQTMAAALQAGHSSGNDSEWVDMVETELRQILDPRLFRSTGAGGPAPGGPGGGGGGGGSSTPPLPALPLGDSPAGSRPGTPPTARQPAGGGGGLSQPDLLEAMSAGVGGAGGGGGGGGGGPTVRRSGSNGQSRNWGGRVQEVPLSRDARDQRSRHRIPVNTRLASVSSAGRTDGDAGDVTSMTTGLDLESMLDQTTDQTTDDESTVLEATADGPAIRKQLESLEGMYSEVLRLLGGGQRRGPPTGRLPRGGLTKHRMYGSMSSLPSSIGARPVKERRRDDRKKLKDMKGINKRFQRLESHVVTLARSVAHLSSEMRTQHLMFQEMENIRTELTQLRTSPGRALRPNRPSNEFEAFRDSVPSLTHPGRVRKLTKFFGDEPPLLRIFLKKLGYEKYAALFERERIGMIELPYMTEDRLQKLGIPIGPRLRILQEAQMSLRNDNFNVYIL